MDPSCYWSGLLLVRNFDPGAVWYTLEQKSLVRNCLFQLMALISSNHNWKVPHDSQQLRLWVLWITQWIMHSVVPEPGRQLRGPFCESLFDWLNSNLHSFYIDSIDLAYFWIVNSANSFFLNTKAKMKEVFKRDLNFVEAALG